MTGLPRRVLALGAHPDDIELLCAGTLAKFVEAGSDVHLAIACQGDRGGDAANRRTEAERSAAILKAPLHWLGFGDARLFDTGETRDRFIDLLRLVRPDLVITHGPNDYHDDHVRVSELACKCAWFAASAGHPSQHPALEMPPAIVYMDNVAAVRFEPTHLVDMTGTMSLKRQMLACHASQLARSDGGISALAELAETQARLRGFQCGVRYAEAFQAAPLWGRRRAEPILP